MSEETRVELIEEAVACLDWAEKKELHNLTNFVIDFLSKRGVKVFKTESGYSWELDKGALK